MRGRAAFQRIEVIVAALHDEIRNAKTNLVFARELGDQKLIDERAQLLDELLDQVPRTAMQEIQP